MKKFILILLLLASLAVAWWYFAPPQPAEDNIATVENVNVKEVIAERNRANNQEEREELDTGEEAELSSIEPENTVAEVSNASGTEEIDLPDGRVYSLSDESSVEWVGKRVGSQHNGTVTLSEGVIIVNNNDTIIGGRFVMDMQSIRVLDIDDKGFENKLKSWFNASEYPTAEFILLEASGGSVVGILTMNGISKQITFPATIIVEDDTVIASAEFAIDRTEWDVNNSVPAVSKFVELSLNLTWTQ